MEPFCQIVSGEKCSVAYEIHSKPGFFCACDKFHYVLAQKWFSTGEAYGRHLRVFSYNLENFEEFPGGHFGVAVLFLLASACCIAESAFEIASVCDRNL